MDLNFQHLLLQAAIIDEEFQECEDEAYRALEDLTERKPCIVTTHKTSAPNKKRRRKLSHSQKTKIVKPSSS
ncbi:hypothetical protein INT45_012179 [Circinella minor]|uniref:Uncharacterized protein n=1 Tax=Circinella minor TaxID=1195481 RepID=A0A8H7SAD6_9FUNG|nr:hypothetical protein INT45_012179 [Circinella minor]